MRIKKSKQNLSYENKFTFNMGELVPFLVQEVVPGQIARFGANVLLRTQPLVAPIMHRIDTLMWYIYIPYRLLQTNFEDFMTGGLQGNANISSPIIKSPANTGFAVGSLADYLNYATGVPDFESLAWGFRAYAKAFNDYFVNQNIEGQELPLSLGDGLDTTTNTTLQNKNWRRDYFTGNLPWPQRGPDVYLPLGVTAPVRIEPGEGFFALQDPDGHWGEVAKKEMSPLTYGAGFANGTSSEIPLNQPLKYYGGLKGTADLASSSSVTINQIRLSAKVQEVFESLARGGARFIEMLYNCFGVVSGDARLQRSEYFGGSKSPFIISEVLQTSETTETSPQANMSGRGICAVKTKRIKKYFPEHGIVLGLMCVSPEANYFQGSPRMYNRRSRFDYLWPQLTGIGEQPTLNKEVFAAHSDPDGTFGYNPRNEEYRRNLSQIHADFKTSLKFWTLAREFENEPALNADFVRQVPSKRVFAVEGQEYDSIICDVWNEIYSYSPLPKRGVPGITRI
ncbi:MAG: major capsid protein [Microviridae sp.]|nr:MAG: major capsid protein [Microviridae sp.]